MKVIAAETLNLPVSERIQLVTEIPILSFVGADVGSKSDIQRCSGHHLELVCLIPMQHWGSAFPGNLLI